MWLHCVIPRSGPFAGKKKKLSQGHMCRTTHRGSSNFLSRGRLISFLWPLLRSSPAAVSWLWQRPFSHARSSAEFGLLHCLFPPLASMSAGCVTEQLGYVTIQLDQSVQDGITKTGTIWKSCFTKKRYGISISHQNPWPPQRWHWHLLLFFFFLAAHLKRHIAK